MFLLLKACLLHPWHRLALLWFQVHPCCVLWLFYGRLLLLLWLPRRFQPARFLPLQWPLVQLLSWLGLGPLLLLILLMLHPLMLGLGLQSRKRRRLVRENRLSEQFRRESYNLHAASRLPISLNMLL